MNIIKDRPMPRKIPQAVKIPEKQVKELITNLLREKNYIPLTHQVLAIYLGAAGAGHSNYIKVTIIESEREPGIEAIYEE